MEVPPGATILEAARQLGIDIPTLCFLEGCRPSTSCLVCVVKVRGTARLVPSCATVAVEGMEVESETAEVHQVRADGAGTAAERPPGRLPGALPLRLPGPHGHPAMLRQIAAGNLREAIATVKHDIALPAVLGASARRRARRAAAAARPTGPCSICQLKRFVADVDLASGDRYLPPQKPATGKRVAIVGAGPTGLSAAYYLLAAGPRLHDLRRPAKARRTAVGRDQPEPTAARDVLEAEIAPILGLGAELRMNTAIGDRRAFDDLLEKFDAVLVA